jgi:hypothetical protein
MTREQLASHMRATAERWRPYDGRNTDANQLLLQMCSHYHPATFANMIFSRDAGMHSSGWWKNPDYERCYHLSISFAAVSAIIGAPPTRLPHNAREAVRWCEALFGDDKRYLWIEGPFSEHGHAYDVWHYRLFCDPAWNPIKPRGEVYSRDWTPAEWRSWSDVHGVENGDGEFGRFNGSAA